jgi:hypothetical protein
VTLYSVYAQQGEGPVAVADRFSWSAALVPPVHALVHGLWLLLIGWVVGTALIAGLSLWIGGEAGFWLYVLFATLIGFEAPAFRRVRTARRGGAYQGDYVAEGEDLALVEYLKRSTP